MFTVAARWRGLTAVGVLTLSLSLVTGQILETYRSAVDQTLGTRSQTTVSDASADEADTWSYESEFTSAQEAFDGLRAFAQEEAQETFVLLKNDNATLPITQDAKITMLGVRSYAPVFGSSGGSIADASSVVEVADAFAEKGFRGSDLLLIGRSRGSDRSPARG